MAFNFGTLPLTGPVQGGFQLGAAAPVSAGALPIAPGVAPPSGGGGFDIGAALGLIQNLAQPQGLGLTGPPPGQGQSTSRSQPGTTRSPTRSRSGGSGGGSQTSRRSTFDANLFNSSFRGQTGNRAQEIARLVGGTVTNQGIEQGPEFIDSDQFDRVNTTITIGGRPFSFTQLENALVNRGVAGLANTLALEGGVTNQFTNDNATAGSFGRF